MDYLNSLVWFSLESLRGAFTWKNIRIIFTIEEIIKIYINYNIKEFVDDYYKRM